MFLACSSASCGSTDGVWQRWACVSHRWEALRRRSAGCELALWRAVPRLESRRCFGRRGSLHGKQDHAAGVLVLDAGVNSLRQARVSWSSHTKQLQRGCKKRGVSAKRFSETRKPARLITCLRPTSYSTAGRQCAKRRSSGSAAKLIPRCLPRSPPFDGRSQANPAYYCVPFGGATAPCVAGWPRPRRTRMPSLSTICGRGDAGPQHLASPPTPPTRLHHGFHLGIPPRPPAPAPNAPQPSLAHPTRPHPTPCPC